MITNFDEFCRVEDVTAGAKVITREGELDGMVKVLSGCLDEIARRDGWFGSPEMIAKCDVEGDTAYYEIESRKPYGKDGYLLVYMMPQTLSPYLLFGFSEDDVDLHSLKPSNFQFSINDVEHKYIITSIYFIVISIFYDN